MTGSYALSGNSILALCAYGREASGAAFYEEGRTSFLS